MIYDNPNPQYVVNMQQGVLDALHGTGLELVIRPCNRSDPGLLDGIRTFVELQKLAGVVLPPSVSEDEGRDRGPAQARLPYMRIAWSRWMLPAPQ
jgi:LacI family transcriptional regulator